MVNISHMSHIMVELKAALSSGTSASQRRHSSSVDRDRIRDYLHEIIVISDMNWGKSPSSAQTRTRPYQGVRVKDPVKELLRRKRSLEPRGTKTVPPTANVVAHNNHQCSYTEDVPAGPQAEPPIGGLQCVGWKTAPMPVTSAGLQSAVTPWSPSDSSQQDGLVQTLAYTAPSTLTADIYMQTLCPSYTMLTYTHTPLLTNFGTIPVAPAPASLPQMDHSDSGLTYLPWAQPLTTISTMPSPGVQFAPASAALPGSPVVHMPLSMSLTAMIPQLEAQSMDPQQNSLELQQRSDPKLDPQPEVPSLDDDPDEQPESPSLLDKLLEDQKNGVEDGKNSYSSSVFIEDV